MPASTVEFEKHGPVAEIRLNRPDKLNAVDAQMNEELCAAIDNVEQDNDVRAIILSGNGRAFSAGFDLKFSERDPGVSDDDHTRGELQRAFDLIMRFWDCPKPIIAAVHGYCLGSSLEISAVCDITIAAEDC